ncbi:hypothetical protein MAHJHV28_47260 [Mycobacterium avium subsp. hominissuis]
MLFPKHRTDLIGCAVTVQPIRSVRCLGNSTPRDTSPTWWPARPMRCSPLAGLTRIAERAGLPAPDISVGVRRLRSTSTASALSWDT